MHPAALLIRRVGELLEQAAPNAKVFLHRTLPLSDEHQELPAVVVSMQSDEILSAASTMDDLGSLLSFDVSVIDSGSDEQTLIESLLELRTAVHRAVMVPDALGFPWAIEVGYLGTSSPVSDNSGGRVAKELTTRWQIAYRMNRFDPDIPV